MLFSEEKQLFLEDTLKAFWMFIFLSSLFSKVCDCVNLIRRTSLESMGMPVVDEMPFAHSMLWLYPRLILLRRCNGTGISAVTFAFSRIGVMMFPYSRPLT